MRNTNRIGFKPYPTPGDASKSSNLLFPFSLSLTNPSRSFAQARSRSLLRSPVSFFKG